MTVTGVSNVQPPQTTEPPVTRRSAEDQAGRKVMRALNAGDLAAAQAAYNELASFGPNNSGPFTAPAMVEKFQAVGQAIQAGDLKTARSEARSLGVNLLQQDFQTAEQAYKTGGWSGAHQAIANLARDYWAVTGNPMPGPTPAAGANAQGESSSAVNVQA